jgi:hypothetical protein
VTLVGAVVRSLAGAAVAAIAGGLVARWRRRRARHQADADRFSKRELMRRGWGPTR